MGEKLVLSVVRRHETPLNIYSGQGKSGRLGVWPSGEYRVAGAIRLFAFRVDSHGAIIGDDKQCDPDNLRRPSVAAVILFPICAAKDS
jgi:hypothetical protein